MALLKGLVAYKSLLVLGYVVLGLVAAYASRGDVANRRWVNVFIVYTLLVSLGVGLSQREVWPFSAWPFIAATVKTPVTQPRFVAIDAHGDEHEIDYRAWAPLEFAEFMGWADANLLRLDSDARNRVAAYLLGRIEPARAQWASGKGASHFERYLGPVSAPFFLGHPAWWDVKVPEQSFVGLRLYNETWDVEERWRDADKITRKLVFEYRLP